ncbi:hypothetical protein L9F63_010511, partial [Diploptera punctata]
YIAQKHFKKHEEPELEDVQFAYFLAELIEQKYWNGLVNFAYFLAELIEQKYWNGLVNVSENTLTTLEYNSSETFQKHEEPELEDVQFAYFLAELIEQKYWNGLVDDCHHQMPMVFEKTFLQPFLHEIKTDSEFQIFKFYHSIKHQDELCIVVNISFHNFQVLLNVIRCDKCALSDGSPT